MTAYVQEHPEDNAIVLWLAALTLAAVIGFGLGASLDSGQPVSDPMTANPSAQSYPDWHGNVKRSHSE